jgi:hypothetical protein
MGLLRALVVKRHLGPLELLHARLGGKATTATTTVAKATAATTTTAVTAKAATATAATTKATAVTTKAAPATATTTKATTPASVAAKTTAAARTEATTAATIVATRRVVDTNVATVDEGARHGHGRIGRLGRIKVNVTKSVHTHGQRAIHLHAREKSTQIIQPHGQLARFRFNNNSIPLGTASLTVSGQAD